MAPSTPGIECGSIPGFWDWKISGIPGFRNPGIAIPNLQWTPEEVSVDGWISQTQTIIKNNNGDDDDAAPPTTTTITTITNNTYRLSDILNT